MRRRFFVEKFEDRSATLRGDSAEHLGRVLRAEAGQLYELSDGEKVWLGRVEQVSLARRGDSRVDFALLEPIASREPALEILLLISLVKFDRFEWCLEKATELGATEIIPLTAARSEKALVASAEKRRARWEKIVLESAQQSRRLRPPGMSAAQTPELAFSRADHDFRCKVLLSERREAGPMREALTSGGSITRAALAIGPEGGWTEAEIAAARGAGFVEASMGENILRTETAVLASLAILRFAAGV